MTGERMTQGDARLRDALAAAVHNEVLLRVACRDTRWEDWTDIADALAPVVERIVAARVGEVVERVEAVLTDWQLRDSRFPTMREIDSTVRAALRAADAPVPTREREQEKEQRAWTRSRPSSTSR